MVHQSTKDKGFTKATKIMGFDKNHQTLAKNVMIKYQDD